MEKKKNWQLFLILSVFALTVYNILPTVFYYCKPLKQSITETQAKEISRSIEKRINQLEIDAQDWIYSFCNLLEVTPQSVRSEGQNIIITFSKSEEATKFRTFLPKAGSSIPFQPSQLRLLSQGDSTKDVIVQRQTPLLPENELFLTAKKETPLYREVIIDRAAQIASILAGPSETAFALMSQDPRYLDTLASQINTVAELLPNNRSAASRLAASLTQGPFPNKKQAVESLISSFANARDQLKGKEGLEKQEMRFIKAESFLKKHTDLFSSSESPLTVQQIKDIFSKNNTLHIGKRNPLFSEITIDWDNCRINLKAHLDTAALKQPIINEVAKITRYSNETLTANEGGYSVDLHSLNDFSTYLLLDLEKLAQKEGRQIQSILKAQWLPKHPDLASLQVIDSKSYDTLSPEEQALSLVVYSDGIPRISAKGIDSIFQNYLALPESELKTTFNTDFRSLASLLEQYGYFAYRGANNEIIFEKHNYVDSILAASCEDFKVKGTHKYALLEMSNLEQRIRTENTIATKRHENLLKWKDEYNAAQVNLSPSARYLVPKPTRNIWLNNLYLTCTKFFRGDENNVLHWGLDLSGGKTVQVELRDSNNQVVKNEEDLKQGMNELYTRVNKMGVSEVAIRKLGHNIVLDFPGSQTLSAAELIKATSMYFHIVNEKFSLNNPALADSVNSFLQEVWNEALVTNQKNGESLNFIAYRHLHGESISESAKALLGAGLEFHSPDATGISQDIESQVSKIAIMKGSDHRSWHGQSHPLMFVFKNFVLEGANLEQVQAHYDPQEGNYLSLSVQSGAPRNSMHSWTSKYAEERIAGTELANYSASRGWRMAVLHNDIVISSPTLNGVLSDSATIKGGFSQREASQLAADLRAGSLTFSPHILSEKNVSPELGQKDRAQGINATIFAFVLVIIAMVAYYRFAGVVASVAVLLNLLILWATLQNIGATLSLAGIAGIILTVGMAVDANVLVFERIKEEFALTGKIAPAIAIGYKKAYSAIVDSNVTTIIAALILLNFDAGPIKGFAITLIIGIVSSMFTALFVTRYYFTGWVKNSKNTSLKMASWVKAKSIDFLKYSKISFAVAISIIVAGSYFVYVQRASIFGMDFTGGFSLHLEVEPKTDTNYIHLVEQALVEQGASTRDFQVRELSPSNHLRILFGTSMQQVGKPFHGMPIQTDKNENPHIQWVLEALNAKNLHLTEHSKNHLAANWTAMSGQMSDTMRNHALIGLLVSFVCIFIYITFRFEYKFAAASIICLLHDVLITVGILGLLHAFGVPVQIDLNTVAALMTIIGYSLNDTIIIFDRIREEMKVSRNKSLPQIINSALNATLSRTTITSGTTLLVLVALVIFGGSSVFSFALVMTVGVILGTLSSWFIASPLMLFFHKKEEKKYTVLTD